MSNYVFTEFDDELSKLPETHVLKVRRESGITYRDDYAVRVINSISPELYNQTLQGWSRSYYLPELHLETILKYGSKDYPITSLNQQVYQLCIDEVQKGLSSLQRVRAFDILSELDKVSFKSSSAAGYDYQGAKGPPDGFNHSRAIRRAKAIMWSVKDDGSAGMDHAIKSMVPDVSHTRTQLADLSEKTKIRGVWGRAFHYILLEGITADPLIQGFTKADTFYHIGGDPLESVPALLSNTAQHCKWIYSLDWKQFDSSVSRFEINTAFDIIKTKVDFPNLESEITFEISRQLFIHKKIAAPDGNIYWSHKGIPSGSYFTSIIGSIVNRLRIEYLWRTITGHGPIMCSTQGDDSLCGDDELVKPRDLASLANTIGWYFNPDKTEYSTVPELVTFLGRTSKGGLNTRNLKKCIRLLAFPEYPVDSGRISAYRARAISKDAGSLSAILNKVASRLKSTYGLASEEEVPHYFKRYVPGM
ncbi:TPA_asm: RNA-dependent RNA polymerase [Arceuthobium sichuanense virus 7]|nr:TPA_asm: RNA-dependent RNA polymerase [Arceuthobium sichuanense virus 7]